MKKIFSILVLCLLSFTIMPINANAEESNVAYSINDDGSYTYYVSVEYAMDASRNYHEIYLTKDWHVSSTIDIVEGTTSRLHLNNHTITSDNKSNIFTLHPNSSLYLYDGTITGGNAKNGGAFYLKKEAYLYLSSMTVKENTASSAGAAIYMDGVKSVVEMYNTSITNNATSKNNGNVYINGEDAKIKMQKSDITYNTGRGLTINDDGVTVQMENESNISFNNGGGIIATYSWFNIFSNDKTAFVNSNTSKYNGAGLFVNYRIFGSNHGVVSGVNFYGNYSETDGGGIYLCQNNTTLKDCIIGNNVSDGKGGGIYNYGNNTIENCTISNNVTSSEGGGVFAEMQYDVTLKGKVIIKDNRRKNSTTKDDLFLGSNNATILAYIIADGISKDSMVGIRSGESGNRLLVENLSDFEYGKTFFLDYAGDFHLEYHADENELRQNKGSTTYLVTLNGKEYGRYKAGESVGVGSSVAENEVFKSWTSNNAITLEDSQKYSDYLKFYMPAMQVDLTYDSFKAVSNLSVNITYPLVGEKLPATATVSWNGGSVESFVRWYKKESDTTFVRIEDREYKAQANETYFAITTIEKDSNKELGFNSSIKEDNVLVTYGTSKGEKASSVRYNNSDGSISINGKQIQALSSEQITSVKPISFSLPVNINEKGFKDALNTQLKKGSIAYSTLGRQFKLTLNEINVDDLFDENGHLKDTSTHYINLSSTINNTDNLNLGSITSVPVVIKMETRNTVTKVTNTDISFFVDESIDKVKMFVPNQVLVTTRDNKKYVVYTDKNSLNDLLKDVTDENNKLKLPSDGSNTITFEVPLITDKDIVIYDAKLKVTLNIKQKTETSLNVPTLPTGGTYAPLASAVTTSDFDEGINLQTNLEDYKFDENGFYVKATADEGTLIHYEITGLSTSSGTCNSGDYILLGSGDVYSLTVWATKDSYESSKLTVEYILDGEPYEYNSYLENPTFETIGDTYLPDDEDVYGDNSTMKLAVKLSSSFNIKYFIGDDYTNIYDYDKENSIELSCLKNETKTYTITAWADNGNTTSECVQSTYVLDYVDNYDINDLYINLNVNTNSIEVGKSLPDEIHIYGKAQGQGFDVYKTIDSYTNASIDDAADYSTSYVARIDIDENLGENASLEDKKNALEDINVNINLDKAHGEVVLEEGKFILYIYYPVTESKEIEEEKLSYTLESIELGDYTKSISFKQALELNNDFTYYPMPYVLLNLKDSNNKTSGLKLNASDLFKVIRSFDSNNSNKQQIILKADIASLIPSYVNYDGVDTALTLTINVASKESSTNNQGSNLSCEEYMNSKNWTWSETKKACVYRVSNTSSK